MTTGTATFDLPAGFLIEAQEYVASLREYLTGNGKDHSQTLAEMHRLLSVLSNSALMLNLEKLAELVAPSAQMLGDLVEAESELDSAGSQKLMATLDQIEVQINELMTPPTEEKQMSSGKSGGLLPPDLPPELVEIFTLEAQEHCQAIQQGLDRLRKEPDNTDLLAEIRRVTHTLKGAAASVGFAPMAHLAHWMEEITEHALDNQRVLSSEELDLLFDTTDTLDALLGIEPLPDLDTTFSRLDTRYAKLLNETVDPATALVPSESPTTEMPHLPARRPENFLRISEDLVDTLINRVGEVVINRSAMVGQFGTLRDLLGELGHSTRRLRRITHEIDVQVERSAIGRLGGHEDVDLTFDPLEMDRYTLLHQLVRELDEVTADTSDVNNQLQYLSDDFNATLNRERRLTTELQDGLMGSRLVSFHEIETRLRNTVRRTARDLGKQAEIVLTGFDTQVDKTILDALADPLMHLLRNAIDHGIELPEQRVESKKAPTGLVTLNVFRERGRVMLTLSDDGAGIDIAAVRRRAIEQGLLPEGEQADDKRVLDVLFEEGFSLAKTVTHTSGRGIGLNIVRRGVDRLQGTLRLDTSAKTGTTFTISVPITLAITRALFVRSADQIFAVPLEQILAVLRLDPAELKEIQSQNVLHYEGRALRVYNLATFLTGTDAVTDQRYGLVIESGDIDTVVLLDGLVGTQEAVVKSLGSHLRRVHGVSGATISGDGRVILILDLLDLIGEEATVHRPASRKPEPQTPKLARSHVLVVDDSLSVRRVVSMFLERSGWKVTAAKDGIDALEKISEVRPDVALVDIEMPRMNGYELLSRIKSDPTLQDIPVVFLTSRAAAKHRERADQLQVDGYLVKPYREEELLDTLLGVMQKQ